MQEIWQYFHPSCYGGLLKTKEVIKYVGLMVSQNTVKHGESLNVMVML